VPTSRRYRRRSSRVTVSRLQMTELWLGPGRDGSCFESDEHRRAAWFYNRDLIMHLWGKNGRRPLAWWLYEAPQYGMPPRHPGEHQQSILFEFPEFAGVLSERERIELETHWKKEFDKTWAAGFSFFKEGRIFTGEVARELHWLWVDLPPPVLEKFMAGRQRRSHAIRKLEENGTPVPVEATAKNEDHNGKHVT